MEGKKEDKMRKDRLSDGSIYHIYSKSISGFKIFQNDAAFFRITAAIRYYRRCGPKMRLAEFLAQKDPIELSLMTNLVDIIAYCIMPTHIHLVLKQIEQNGISTFMSNLLNSYTRYFNLKHKRKGPLWEGRFKNVLVKTDEQLLHLTRYIHLNPVTDYLVDNPVDWPASSYREYIGQTENKICNFNTLLDISTVGYKEFVENRIEYQRSLAAIKKLTLE